MVKKKLDSLINNFLNFIFITIQKDFSPFRQFFKNMEILEVSCLKSPKLLSTTAPPYTPNMMQLFPMKNMDLEIQLFSWFEIIEMLWSTLKDSVVRVAPFRSSFEKEF